jgi:hypothetical protein
MRHGIPYPRPDTRQRIARTSVGLLTAIALCGGCGEEEAKADTSGVARDAKVNDLSEQDASLFCRWLVAQSETLDVSEVSCTHTAVFIAKSAEECTQLREECLGTLAQQVPRSADERCVRAPESTFYDECGSPVGLIEDCIAESKRATDKRRALSCADVGTGALKTYMEPEAPSCGPLWSECFP